MNRNQWNRVVEASPYASHIKYANWQSDNNGPCLPEIHENLANLEKWNNEPDWHKMAVALGLLRVEEKVSCSPTCVVKVYRPTWDAS